MARAYTVGTVALVLNATPKWVDNLLSHHTIAGVIQHRQGIARRITIDGLIQLALALRLIQDLHVPIASGLHLAGLLTSNGGAYTTPGGIQIKVDPLRVRADLELKLAQAVETAPVPRRGRPARSTSNNSSKTGRLE